MWPLTLLLSSPALSHAGATIAGIDVHRHADGVTVLEGTFGLLLDSGGGEWRWVCHEAVTTPDAVISPRYQRAADGVMVAVVPDLAQARDEGVAVYRSPDGGCSWDAVGALAGLAVRAVAVHPADPLRWAAVTDEDGAVWRSDDGGLSWSEALPGVEGRVFSAVALTAGGVLWATGHEGDGQLLVAWSEDGGATFAEHHHPAPEVGSGVGTPTLSVLATVDPASAWLAAGPTTGDALWRTTDGGQTVQPVLEVDGDLVDGGVAGDGAVWVLEGSRSPWRSTDGDSFTELTGVPLGIGLQALDREALTTSFAEYTGELVTRVDVDGSWQSEVRPPDIVGTLTCIDGTEQRDICEPLWPEVEAGLAIYVPAEDGDSGPSEDGGSEAEPPEGAYGGGCACGGGPGPATGWLALVALAGLRRRATARRAADGAGETQ